MTDNKNKRYQYKLYKLCSDYCDDFYIGSTRDFTTRKSNHKSACNYINNKEYNQKKYKTIRANGGWENWRIVVIELMQNATKLEAQIREEELRTELDATLNSMKATRGLMTEQEYRNQYRIHNKELLYQKQNQKYECTCGGKYTKQNKAGHMKTKKHQNYISKNNL